VNPLWIVLITAAAACTFAWCASLITRDYSWVDRSWSILPVVYVLEFAGAAHFSDVRLDVMAAVVFVWGARLTFNFARKGGYSGVEDYRWAVLRSKMNQWQFQLFNLFFIVLYQNFILVIITLPAYIAYQNRSDALGAVYVVVAAAFLACTAGETIADQQQWDFHKLKASELASGRTPDPQFCQTGLFRYSRHPAYFFELAQWWLVFVMGAITANWLFQISLIGPVLLTALFIGSTRFTESITLTKYPEYAKYQEVTSPVVPWFVRTRGASASLSNAE